MLAPYDSSKKWEGPFFGILERLFCQEHAIWLELLGAHGDDRLGLSKFTRVYLRLLGLLWER